MKYASTIFYCALGAVGFALVAIPIGWALFGPDKITIHRETIQDKIAEQVDRDIPIRNPKLARVLKSVKATKVVTTFYEGGVEAAASLEGLVHIPIWGDKKFTATFYGRGSVRLDGNKVMLDLEEKSFEIRKIVVDERTLADNFAKFADTYLAGELNLFAKARAAFVQEVTVSFTQSVAERVVKRRPVYTLAGWKGTLAAWAVQGIYIHPNGVDIAFSLGSLLAHAMSWVVGGVGVAALLILALCFVFL